MEDWFKHNFSWTSSEFLNIYEAHRPSLSDTAAVDSPILSVSLDGGVGADGGRAEAELNKQIISRTGSNRGDGLIEDRCDFRQLWAFYAAIGRDSRSQAWLGSGSGDMRYAQCLW